MGEFVVVENVTLDGVMQAPPAAPRMTPGVIIASYRLAVTV
jgi:hypothetical protein